MLKLLYLVHDLADPAVRRRVLMFSTGGAEVTLAGFRRGENALAVVEGLTPIELGMTADGKLGQRAAAVARACMSVGGKLGGVAKPDVIVARNLEMLAVANRANALFGGAVPIAYECLDIHRVMLREDLIGKGLRATEAMLGRKAGLLITSSPAFIEHYFRPLSGLDLPSLLLQNQVIELDNDLDAPAAKRVRSPGAPWRIGWFGAIRCAKSLELLSKVSRSLDGRIEVVLRGRPAYQEFDDFDGRLRDEAFMSFHGPYRNPEELAAIYGDVHFSWAIDFFEESQNSSWLLPNRLYEGCRHGSVPIAIDGTETARFLKERGLGVILPDASPRHLAAAFETMTEQAYADHCERLDALGPAPWSFGRADCERLVSRLSHLAGGERTATQALAHPTRTAATHTAARSTAEGDLP